jgi:hypothetical protein
MHRAKGGALVEPLASLDWLRLVRKPVNPRRYICEVASVSFQGEAPV